MLVGAAAEEEGRLARRQVLAGKRRQLRARPKAPTRARGRPSIGPLRQSLRRARRGTVRRSVAAPIVCSMALRSASRQRQITHLVGLPHDEAKTDIVGTVGADALGDGLADLGALLFGNAGAVEPAAAEGRDPLRQCRSACGVGRSIRRASISVKPALLIDARRTPRPTDTSSKIRAAADSRGRPARRRASRAVELRLPSPPISPAKRPPGFSARKIALATRSLSSIQCSAAFEKAASNSRVERHVRRVHVMHVDADRLRRPRPAPANCRPRRRRRHARRSCGSAPHRRSQRRGSARPAWDRAGRAQPRRGRRRSGRPAHSPRRSSGWSRRRWSLRASSPSRDRRLRPSGLRSRTDCRA